MSLLKQISTGIKKRPHFLGLYGPGGVGKSTMGADAPLPVFLGTDDGEYPFRILANMWGLKNLLIAGKPDRAPRGFALADKYTGVVP